LPSTRNSRRLPGGGTRRSKASIFNANVNSNIDAALNKQRAVEEVRTQFARIGA
jgi:hypothetical protein